MAVSESTSTSAATSTVSGNTRNYAAAVGTNGTLDNLEPKPRQRVNALAVSGSTVYLGGYFTTVGGTTQNYAAAVGTDGTLASWNPNVNNTVNALAISGSTVYLGGFFIRRWHHAQLRGGSWNRRHTRKLEPKRQQRTVARACDFGINRLPRRLLHHRQVAPHCNNAAAVGTNGTLSGWDPNPNFGVAAISISGSTVYLGGYFTTLGGTPATMRRQLEPTARCCRPGLVLCTRRPRPRPQPQRQHQPQHQHQHQHQPQHQHQHQPQHQRRQTSLSCSPLRQAARFCGQR